MCVLSLFNIHDYCRELTTTIAEQDSTLESALKSYDKQPGITGGL